MGVQVEVEVEVEMKTRTRSATSVRSDTRPQPELWEHQLAEKAKQEERAKHARYQKVAEYTAELDCLLESSLRDLGYNPPDPSPFIGTRALQVVARQVKARVSDPIFSEALAAVRRKIEDWCKGSFEYLAELMKSLNEPMSIWQKIKQISSRVHSSIYQAVIGFQVPEVAPSLKERIKEIECFLAASWGKEEHRGVLAIHIDRESQSTIIQIGIAEHGPMYITIPEVLEPEDQALNSIRELLRRLPSFCNTVDPMAIIDGSHQQLNYNEVFPKSRVVRAPSGNTSRLIRNLDESARRERLSSGNTVILNSAPKSREEYVRVFDKDQKARGWPAWDGESAVWKQAAASNGFATSSDVSRQSLLTALTQKKNVIVIMAHCDGERIHLPEPPPDGSVVTADYLLEHRAQIEANAPFVYLFSCQAGNLPNLRNFASTLLECGASGVIASQANVGSAEAITLFGRLLNDRRGAPPIEDFFQASREVNSFDMEAFLA